jgi:hypothetical protein
MEGPGRDRRKQVDLTRLPSWLQYLIALVVTAVVVGLALTRHRPATAGGIVAAGVAALLVVVLLAWRASRNQPKDR